MNESFLLAATTAVWLGFLTSISPCPLASNIAAVSYIGRQVGVPRRALMRGVLYTLGRVISYVGISGLLVAAALSVPEVALFLQHEFNVVLGPILVLVGLVLIGIIRLPVRSGATIASRLQGRIDKLGTAGALVLGILFALSFCPISAALFFGSLIPLSLDHSSPVMLPLLYGLGTALPVVAFAVLLVFATHLVARAYNALSVLERWARPITGAVFLLVGGYFCMEYLIGV